MPKNSGSNINIKKVKGNVVFSNNQSGGITTNEQNLNHSKPQKKPFYKKVLFWVGVISAILTILGYFGFQPKPERIKKTTLKKDSPNLNTSIINQTNKFPILQDTSKHKKTHSRKKVMENDKKPINVGNVTGDVTISQNQLGGITAHTVIQNYGKPIPTARHLNSEDQQRLNTLSSSSKISIWICMKEGEANAYGVEIINYLKAKGYDLEINGYMQTMGGNNERFDINGTSISVPVQE